MMQTTIQMYTPKGLYGFLSNPDGEDLYFHLSVFDPGSYSGEHPVPPIVGESVDVVVENGKVLQCSRIDDPKVKIGVIDWFDSEKGYGFILSEEGQVYLHRSEVIGGRLPLKGRRVSFYVSAKVTKGTRACHVSVMDETR